MKFLALYLFGGAIIGLIVYLLAAAIALFNHFKDKYKK
jgi:hypothetical protein